MIEGIETVSKLFKTVDLGIKQRDQQYSLSSFDDMMEFSPEALAASSKANSLYSEMQSQLEPLTSLVQDALKEQFTLSGDAQKSIQDKAQELLNGYFSAENTADRIFGFAFSFFNDGQDRQAFASEMRGYIDKGFAQAEKLLGGLADISLDTRDLIYQKIDDFTNETQETSPESAEA